MVRPSVMESRFELLQHLDAFLGQAPLLSTRRSRRREFFETHRLEDEIAGAFADGLFVAVIAAVPGHDDHIHFEVLADAVGQFQTVHAGQHNVGDDHIHRLGLKHFQGIFGAGGRGGAEPGHLDEFLHGIADGGIVIHDEDMGIQQGSRFFGHRARFIG